MTNGAPNVQRIMRPLPMSEKNTVERAIEIEERVEWLQGRLWELDEILHEMKRKGADYFQIECEIDECHAELFELQREYRG